MRARQQWQFCEEIYHVSCNYRFFIWYLAHVKLCTLHKSIDATYYSSFTCTNTISNKSMSTIPHLKYPQSCNCMMSSMCESLIKCHSFSTLLKVPTSLHSLLNWPQAGIALGFSNSTDPRLCAANLHGAIHQQSSKPLCWMPCRIQWDWNPCSFAWLAADF